jgi:hypothetical protein
MIVSTSHGEKDSIMTSSRSSLACIAALGTAAGVFAASPPAAGAESLQFRIQVPKRLLVTTADSDESCRMEVRVWGAEGPGAAYSRSHLVTPGGSAVMFSRLRPGEPGIYVLGCPITLEDLGKWRIRVIAYDVNGKALGSREDYWYEKYDTVVSDFNAAPEPVRKGRALTVSGRLKRLQYSPGPYIAYSGKTVRIYFKAKGATSWTFMGTTTTSGTGQFRKSFTAARDGVWRAYFAGTSRFDKQASRDDHVDVY